VSLSRSIGMWVFYGAITFWRRAGGGEGPTTAVPSRQLLSAILCGTEAQDCDIQTASFTKRFGVRDKSPPSQWVWPGNRLLVTHRKTAT